MAILARCSKCWAEFSTKHPRCTKCGAQLASGTTYRVSVVMADGKRFTKVCPDLKTAQRVEIKAKTASIEERVLDIKRNPPVADAWDDYLRWARANKRSWLDDKERWEKHVLPVIGRKNLGGVTPADIQAIISRMKSGKTPGGGSYAPNTIHNVFSTVRAVINHAIRMGLWEGSNPCRRVRFAPPDMGKVEYLDTAQVARLNAALDAHHNQWVARVVRFALYTGRRRGEILGLQWQDVDFSSRTVTFQGAITKCKRTQTVPVNDVALRVLRKCQEDNIRHRERPAHVFVDQEGHPFTPDSLTSHWRRIRRDAGLGKFRFHGLRHSFATILISSGEVDLFTLQHLLGHRTSAMTQRYAHLLPGRLHKAAQVMTLAG